MRKIVLLPNLFTTANLVFGFGSMIYSSQANFVHASWLIVAAGVCDLLDGRIARMAKATSPFGVQYDSLSDLTSFGIAPGVLIYHYSIQPNIYSAENMNFGIALAAIYVICAALRLARFNVTAEESSSSASASCVRKGYFQGLPSPVAAGLVVTAVLFQKDMAVFPEFVFEKILVALGLLTGLLMVSNVPFPSFKELKPKSKGNLALMFGIIIAFVFSIQNPAKTFFPIGCIYFFGSLFWSLYICFMRDQKKVVG